MYRKKRGESSSQVDQQAVDEIKANWGKNEALSKWSLKKKSLPTSCKIVTGLKVEEIIPLPEKNNNKVSTYYCMEDQDCPNKWIKLENKEINNMNKITEENKTDLNHSFKWLLQSVGSKKSPTENETSRWRETTFWDFLPWIIKHASRHFKSFFFSIILFFFNLKISFSVFLFIYYFGLFCPPYHQGQGKQDLLFEIMLNLNV